MIVMLFDGDEGQAKVLKFDKSQKVISVQQSVLTVIIYDWIEKSLWF